MNIIKLSILGGVLLASGVAAEAQTADEILDKHIAAIGGAEAWSKVKTMKVSGTMNQQGVDINMTEMIAFGKAARVEISVMGMSGWIIVTPTQGWTYMPFMGSNKIDTLKPEQLKMQQKQLDVRSHQMLDYKDNGSKYEYVGRDTINNAPCYKIKITDKEGTESTSYFDCVSYYLMRTEMKAKVKDEEQEVAIGYSDYKKYDGGIVWPGSMVIAGAETDFKNVEINKPLDDKLFVPKMGDDTTPKAADSKSTESKPEPKK